MPGIDLVVTDLDGTLWDGGERIHRRTRAALGELEDRRVPLLVATGRRPRSAAIALARSGLNPPAVLLDGALGRDLGDGRTFHEHAFSVDEAVAVLAAFDASRLSPCLYVERPEADVLLGPAPSTCQSHVDMLGRWAARADLGRAVAATPVYAFAVCGGEPVALRACAGLVEATGAGRASVTRDLLHGGFTLMVRPLGISKWAGVLAYCDQQGLDSDRVLAIGDGENDVELLTGAAVSCVVSDGCEAALVLADHVVGPAREGGWGRILDLV